MRSIRHPSPYARLCISFAVVIAVGWLLLSMPWAVAEGRAPLRPLDGLFTSVSAVCVTGLTVRNTALDFSLYGQMVIILLIQVGGLGFMTLSSSVLMSLRQRPSLGQIAVIQESLGQPVGTELPRLLARVLKLVFTIEAIGAALLLARFAAQPHEGETWLQHLPEAAWQAIFHSVSAFCNAGFSIFSANPVTYSDDVWVNVVIMGLIIAGGLGLFVMADLQDSLRARRARRPHRLRFQTHMVLRYTAAIILVATALIWVGERENAHTVSMAEAPSFRQILVPLFHVVSARTAGFNSVDMSAFCVFTLGVLIVVMFIGASPGSCGGGVKTTTFAVLAAFAVGALRSGHEPTFRRRSFSPLTVRSAVVLGVGAAILVFFSALFLDLVEHAGKPSSEGGVVFLNHLFEVTSAFATVGLSTGITEYLSAPSKLCLIVLMFLGRVGPLGLISATLRRSSRPELRYPTQEIQIG